MNTQLPEALVVTPLAAEFAVEVNRLSPGPIPLQVCSSAEDVLAVYTDQKILFGNPGIIAPILDQLPAVEWIQSSWAGVTPLMINARRDYTLTGVKDVFGPQMSEFTFGYLLAHELKIAERRRQQASRQWYGEHSGALEGKTIGIMGTGSIGSHIAATAQCFNMAVHGLSRSGSATDGFDLVFGAKDVNEFLATCHYLVSTLPQTAGTDRLLNRKSIERLPDGAYFVNVGRSNVVDDQALIDALESEKLSGAVLDVFDEEPLPDDSPLWDAKNLRVTAHISAVSHPLLIVPVFVENYQRFARNQPLNYVIDFEAGY